MTLNERLTNDSSSEGTGIEITFGSLLRGLRKEMDYSLNRVAKTTGINISYLSRIERDMEPPSICFVQTIADLFNYSRFDLLEAAGKIHVNDLSSEEREELKKQFDQGLIIINK